MNWPHGVDPHSMRGHLEGKTLGELIDRRLRHAVVGHAGELQMIVPLFLYLYAYLYWINHSIICGWGGKTGGGISCSLSGTLGNFFLLFCCRKNTCYLLTNRTREHIRMRRYLQCTRKLIGSCCQLKWLMVSKIDTHRTRACDAAHIHDSARRLNDVG